MDDFARPCAETFAEHPDQRDIAHGHGHLGFRAHGLDQGNPGRQPVFGQREMFRANAIAALAARRCASGQWHCDTIGLKAGIGEGAADNVHGGRADKAGNEDIGRTVIEIERRADLFHPARIHHHDPVGHGHGFHLVMGDVNSGHPEALMQALDLAAHDDAQLGVEIGERLVEQKNLRIAHDGTAHGHALPLTAG